MNRNAFAGAVVLALGLTTALAAQNPPPTQPPAQPPSASQPPSQSMAPAQSVTVEGCLVNEKDVPGRAPNPAEKAGVMEDFILTSARVKSPGAPAPSADQPTGTSGVKGSMFEVKGLEASRLQEFVGQRVEIVGKVDPKDVAERAREKASPSGEPAGDLPEIIATSIKKTEGTCPPVK
jgi:hypothetical protein